MEQALPSPSDGWHACTRPTFDDQRHLLPANKVASMLGSPSLSPRTPIHRIAKSTVYFAGHGGDSPIRSAKPAQLQGLWLWSYLPGVVVFSMEMCRYHIAMSPRSWAWVWVWHLRARGRLVSFFRKAFDSLLFLRPGVCLWSPDHTSKQVAGVLATEAVSSMFPYCCPSSSRKRLTVLIHSATGLKGWPHSCWNPPPHPMMSDFCRRTWFRLEGGMSNGV